MNKLVCPDCGKSFGSEYTFSWHRQSVHVALDHGPANGRASHAATVKDLARRAHQEYGSIDQFAEQVVVEELVRAGLYTREGGLTPAGEAARADLESRMAGVLREMQLQRGSLVEKEPRKALLAAVLAVALGQRRPPEEAELELVGQQVEQGAAMAVAPDEAGGQSGTWLDWHFFNQFDRYFQAMDSEVNAGEAGGDGGDGGSDGGGDGGGD
jgi:hypothetical protein